MRVSSLSTRDACMMLAKVGVLFLAFTFLVGEVLTPISSRMASEFRNGLIGRNISDRFRTGMWSRDTIRENGHDGACDVMVCHPGYLDDYILNNSSLLVPRTKEVEMACDKDLKAWLDARSDIELVTYDNL